ncbi:hypothetical protein KM043_001201 [Ampulex compressa]|nr:hypothetical protein KM043_001201 [Ampulex compressa]
MLYWRDTSASYYPNSSVEPGAEIYRLISGPGRILKHDEWPLAEETRGENPGVLETLLGLEPSGRLREGEGVDAVFLISLEGSEGTWKVMRVYFEGFRMTRNGPLYFKSSRSTPQTPTSQYLKHTQTQPFHFISSQSTPPTSNSQYFKHTQTQPFHFKSSQSTPPTSNSQYFKHTQTQPFHFKSSRSTPPTSNSQYFKHTQTQPFYFNHLDQRYQLPTPNTSNTLKPSHSISTISINTTNLQLPIPQRHSNPATPLEILSINTPTTPNPNPPPPTTPINPTNHPNRTIRSSTKLPTPPEPSGLLPRLLRDLVGPSSEELQPRLTSPGTKGPRKDDDRAVAVKKRCWCLKRRPGCLSLRPGKSRGVKKSAVNSRSCARGLDKGSGRHGCWAQKGRGEGESKASVSSDNKRSLNQIIVPLLATKSSSSSSSSSSIGPGLLCYFGVKTL